MWIIWKNQNRIRENLRRKYPLRQGKQRFNDRTITGQKHGFPAPSLCLRTATIKRPTQKTVTQVSSFTIKLHPQIIILKNAVPFWIRNSKVLRRTPKVQNGLITIRVKDLNESTGVIKDQWNCDGKIEQNQITVKLPKQQLKKRSLQRASQRKSWLVKEVCEYFGTRCEIVERKRDRFLAQTWTQRYGTKILRRENPLFREITWHQKTWSW